MSLSLGWLLEKAVTGNETSPKNKSGGGFQANPDRNYLVPAYNDDSKVVSDERWIEAVWQIFFPKATNFLKGKPKKLFLILMDLVLDLSNPSRA